MAWTTPRTWVDDEIVEAVNLNEQVRDNLSYLHSGQPIGQIVREGVADYAVSGTTWTTVDETNLKITLSVTTGRVRVEAVFRASADNTGGSKGEFDIEVDGATRLGGTNGLACVGQNQAAQFTLSGLFSGLSIGSHVFRLKYRNAQAGATTTIVNNAWPIVFWAHEL